MSICSTQYLFIRDLNNATVMIVSRECWEECKSVSNDAFNGAIDPILPKGFREIAPSVFRYTGTLAQGCEALLRCGFSEVFAPISLTSGIRKPVNPWAVA